jgi:adenylylsulfate kinase-like enzyme
MRRARYAVGPRTHHGPRAGGLHGAAHRAAEAGKSTIADGVAAGLRAERRHVEVLDGDELRRRIAPDLGFGPADRRENLRRIGYVAQLLARHGVTC